MNWRFTRADQWIRFEENEPIAHFFPVERGRVERFTPRIERLEDHDALRSAFEKWSVSRNAFQNWVLAANPQAPADKWQKLYFRGLDPDGTAYPVDHQAKLRVPPFAFADGTVMDPPEAKVCPVRHPPQSTPPGGQALGAPRADGTALLPEQGKAGGQTERGVLLALKRYEWILAVEARQRALSFRANGIPRTSAMSSEDFLDNFYAQSRPVIIEGDMADWPALDLWTPSYLAKLIGNTKIEYQGERNSSLDFDVFKASHRREMPFDAFIAAITAPGVGNDMYMTDANESANLAALAPLQNDLGHLDQYLTNQAGTPWIGPAGTFTPLHFNLANQLFAQVTGTKRFVLSPPSETQRLYPRYNGASAVHDLMNEGQLRQYPAARGTRTYEFELRPGELLFVPTGWWQQVTAVDFSVTLTYTDFLWPNDGASDFPRV